MQTYTPIPTIHLPETHSTNTYLTELCNKQPQAECTTVVADFQTAGRGQRGNTWESAPGCNLLFSLVIYPEFLTAKQQFLISEITALAVQDMLSQYTTDIHIKWPNDIYWKDKKICGMLIENNLCGTQLQRCIAGIGININQNEFTSPAPNPVSLYQITEQTYSLNELLQAFQQHFVQLYNQLKAGQANSINQRYKASLYRKDGYYTYQDKHGIFQAQIEDILPDGTLLLRDTEGTLRSYLFKEVAYIL